MSRLHINLSRFDDLLQDFCIFSCQLLHLTLLGIVLATLLVVVCLSRIVPIYTISNSPFHVLALDFLKALPVIVKALESLKFTEKVALLNHNHITFLVAKDRLAVIGATHL